MISINVTRFSRGITLPPFNEGVSFSRKKCFYGVSELISGEMIVKSYR